MNLSSTDAFRRSPQLFGLCLLQTNHLTGLFHPRFPRSSYWLAAFIWFFTFTVGIGERVLGASVPKVEAAMRTEKKKDIKMKEVWSYHVPLVFHGLLGSGLSQVECSDRVKIIHSFVFSCREPKHASYYHLHYCELVTQGSLSSKIHPKTLSDTDFLRWHWPEQIGRATTITARPCCCVLCTKVHCLPIIFEKFEILSVQLFIVINVFSLIYL